LHDIRAEKPADTKLGNGCDFMATAWQKVTIRMVKKTSLFILLSFLGANGSVKGCICGVTTPVAFISWEAGDSRVIFL